MKTVTDIRFYNAVEFAETVRRLGPDKVLKDRRLRELFYCHPFMMNEVLRGGKPMWLGKIEQDDHPFDVVLVDEDDLRNAHESGTKHLANPLWIQLKEIRGNTGSRRIPLPEWVEIVQNRYINRISKRVRMEPTGVLHLHNKIPLEKIELGRLEEFLKKFSLPEKFPYRQITLSIEIGKEDVSAWGIATWQIYPEFAVVGSISAAARKEIRRIYGLR